MINKLVGTCLLCLLLPLASFADDGDLGQVLQINTDLCSLRANASWLLIIRDVDRGINIPYVYDFQNLQNYWMALTRSRNYLITVSQMQMYTYNLRDNTYHKYVIKNFCGLESNGRIIRGNSISIRISGDLKPYPDTLTCIVSQYPDLNAMQTMGLNQ